MTPNGRRGFVPSRKDNCIGDDNAYAKRRGIHRGAKSR